MTDYPCRRTRSALIAALCLGYVASQFYRTANAAIAPLHDRMPVIVREADYTRWLDASTDGHPLLAPFAEEAMSIEKA